MNYLPMKREQEGQVFFDLQVKEPGFPARPNLPPLF